MAVGRTCEGEATEAEVADIVNDLEAFGAPAEAIAQVLAQLAADTAQATFRVHPDNVTAVRLFEALRTQWTAVALTTLDRAEVLRTGLDYLRLEAAVRLMGLSLGGDDFTRIRIMEAEALAAWAEQRS